MQTYLVEGQIHGSEVDFQLGRVLLLLKNLLLFVNTDLSFLFLELLLGEAGFVLLAFVVFLFLHVKALLVFS